ncbi:cysteine synthase family protein [Candidatus Dependentiae bacterium]|nr:cysteine synthase family protein [Candidatus Dependentiae bacterium]
MMYESLLDAIGNTPLVRVKFNTHSNIYAKLEYLNPGGSVKDRSALYLVELAEKQGLLKPGGTLVDASSGNHGIAVAMIGRLKGYKVIITASEKVSAEKRATIEAYGAQVILCPPTELIEHPESYHSKALEILRNTPNSFMPNQYFNVANRHAHRTILGPEIWRQTNGKITHFFAAAGTCGTVSGVGEFLKSMNPAIKVIAFDSNNSFYMTKGNPKPYKVEGMGIDFASPVLNESVIDEILPVADDNALPMLRTMALDHGLLVGPSSGAVAYGVAQYASKLTDNDLAVFICGDSGRAYLSKGFYGHAEDAANAMIQPAKSQPQYTV